MKHEFLLYNLPLLMKVCSSLYGILDPDVDRNDIGRNTVSGLALTVVYDPETRVWLTSGRVREFRHKTVSSTRVSCYRLIGSITNFLLIHLQSITRSNIKLYSSLGGCPNVSIAGVLCAH